MKDIIFFDKNFLSSTSLDTRLKIESLSKRFSLALELDDNISEMFYSSFLNKDNYIIKDEGYSIAHHGIHGEYYHRTYPIHEDELEIVDLYFFVIDEKYKEYVCYQKTPYTINLTISDKSFYNEILYFTQNFFFDSSFRVVVVSTDGFLVKHNSANKFVVFENILKHNLDSKIFFFEKTDLFYCISSYEFDSFGFHLERVVDVSSLEELFNFLEKSIISF